MNLALEEVYMWTDLSMFSLFVSQHKLKAQIIKQVGRASGLLQRGKLPRASFRHF